MSALDRVAAALGAADCRRQARDWTCPAHDDRRASLSVTEGDDGRVLLHCHAGCSIDDILAALSLTAADLYEAREAGNGHREVVATYGYVDENGELQYEVVRFAPKDFRQRRPDENGAWIWSLGKVRRVLYRLPAVIEATKAGKTIYAVEGERDVESLEKIGLVATCNSGGAGKWRVEYSETLRGADVVIVADKDDPGRKHALDIANALDGIASTVTITESPAPHKDVTDLLTAGGSLDDLTCFLLDTGEKEQQTEPAEPAHPSGLRIQTPDLTLARPPRFAWAQRIVIGYLNLLLGNEGVGKGTLITWLIAMWSLGRLPGDLYGTPANVGIIALEDSFNDVWVPRLHAAGADLSRVRLLERPDGGVITGKEDRDKLALAVELEQLRIVFCDQMSDNIGAVNDWRNRELREGLQPWRWLGSEKDIVVLGSLHPNKKADSFRQLVSGASGFNAISRSSLLLAEHPEDDSRRVLVRGKGNLSVNPPAVEFEIVTHRFDANGHSFSVPKATGFVDGDITVDELIEAGTRPAGPTSVGDASEIIRALIPNDGAWHLAKVVYETCAREQINDRTVQRAVKRLGLERRRAREFQAAVEWRWPTTADTEAPCVNSVGSVGSVGTTSTHTHDTHDIYDIQRTDRECVASSNGTVPSLAMPALPFDLDLTPPAKPETARRCRASTPNVGSILRSRA